MSTMLQSDDNVIKSESLRHTAQLEHHKGILEKYSLFVAGRPKLNNDKRGDKCDKEYECASSDSETMDGNHLI